MTVLTADQLTDIRRAIARKEEVVAWTKPQANAISQALEDWFDTAAVQNSLSNAIDAAVPGLSNQQKKRFVKWWMGSRFSRD